MLPTATLNVGNVQRQEKQNLSQWLHICEEKRECISPDVILGRFAGIPGDGNYLFVISTGTTPFFEVEDLFEENGDIRQKEVNVDASYVRDYNTDSTEDNQGNHESYMMTIKKLKIPPLSVYNGFKYPPIPECLTDFPLVWYLKDISPRIPFIQIRRLRHVYGQYGIYGQSKLKKLAASNKASHQQTGGGPTQIKKMTDIEIKFLQILGDDFGTGLPGMRVEPFERPTVLEEDSGSILTLGDVEYHESPEVMDPGPSRVTQPPPVLPSSGAPEIQNTSSPLRSPRRRRHRRREPPITQDAARRALIAISERRVFIEEQKSLTLKKILQEMKEIRELMRLRARKRAEQQKKSLKRTSDPSTTADSTTINVAGSVTSKKRKSAEYQREYRA
ncbi:unnamed protein product, partial [Leptidea sinapis]